MWTDVAEVEDVEDIFSDWVRILKKSEAKKRQPRQTQKPAEESRAENVDPTDAFWSISLEGDDERQHHQKRRISQVLENLSFLDRPDIFGDECDLLEMENGGGANNKADRAKDSKAKKANKGIKRRNNRPQMRYWNIFDEWKWNLIEDKIARKRSR